MASLPGTRLPQAVFLLPLAGRCALVADMALLPYARRNGLGTILWGNRPRLPAAWAAAALCLAARVALGVFGLAACEIVEAVPAAVLAIWPG